jgi:pyruvate/2-oxoglutarate dehydrogenase complex dihydrolipoamide dehydrogenase (E3) component
VGCAENPSTGHELLEPATAAPGRGATAVVVGAGPAGLHAALELEAAGFETHLLEARERLGGGLVASAAPPLKDKLAWYLDYLASRIGRSAVRVHLGTRADAAEVLRWRPSLAVVAAGARPAPAPIGRIDSDRVVDAYEALMKPVPVESIRDREVVVYGGGETGCETAELLAAHGARVTLVTRSPASRLARGAELGYRKALRQRLARNPAVRILERTRIESIEGDRVRLVDDAGRIDERVADRVFVAQGRHADRSLADALRAAGVAVAAVGDARRVARIGDAVHDAHETVRALIAHWLRAPGHDGGPVPRTDRPTMENPG